MAALHNGHIQESRATAHKLAPTVNDQSDAWWSIGEFSDRGRQMTHQSAKLTLTGNRVFGQGHSEDVWDLSDSLAELYDVAARQLQHATTTADHVGANKKKNAASSTSMTSHATYHPQQTNTHDWLNANPGNGFIRVYPPDMSVFGNSQLVPCTLSTTAHKVCLALGLAVNALHIQLNGDKVRRLDPYEHPLVIQNEYLATLGFADERRIQEEGAKEDLAYQVKFYSGKRRSAANIDQSIPKHHDWIGNFLQMRNECKFVGL